MRRRACAIAGALLLAACDSKPLDWNTLAASRIRDQVPAAQITVVDAKTLEANLGGRVTRIDTAELQLLCNRGPKDCDYAFDQAVQAVIALRGPAREAPK